MATRHAGTDGSGHDCGKGHGLGIGGPEDPMFTLTKGDHHSVLAPLTGRDQHAVALNIYGGNKRADRPEGGFYVREEDTSKTLDAATGLNPTCAQGGTAVMQPVACFEGGQGADARSIAYSEELAPTLPAAEGGNRAPTLLQHMAVRRLTPRECERLQGWEDDYTLISEKTADGPRYKAIGNGWAVPVLVWIAKRVAEVLR